MQLFQNIFSDDYPNNWYKQLLFPITKAGHTRKTPKLRGIAISPMLSRIYDHIINERFCRWYHPNSEQAGYRKGQGCVVQLFSLFMIIEHANNLGKDIFIGLLDFEKAFDYTNRLLLVKGLIKDGAGNKMVRAIRNMYLDTKYVPKISSNYIGDEISSNYGVTQGRKSSANIFSYYISDMTACLKNLALGDFMDPHCLLQLADDTNILAESLHSLQVKFSALYEYSEEKHQYVNTRKTKYMHMSESPMMEPITLDNAETVEPVDKAEGYTFLGFNLSYSNDISKLIHSNLNKKMVNIIKFYAWLDYNENTPFFVKMKVLYTCLFASLLYSVEAWGDVKAFEEKLRKTEKDALKKRLGVKSGTSNDLIYLELNKADIIANIKDRQYKFNKKMINLEPEEAIVKSIWNMCDSQTFKNNLRGYYSQLRPDNKSKNISDRKETVLNSDTTMCIRYRTLIGFSDASILYNSTLIDSKRKIITRWRLSCHKLKIETGRYTKPKTPREHRTCAICEVLDDEYHALFQCKAHRLIRRKYNELLSIHNNVKEILNPKTVESATKIASYLTEIEENMKNLEMVN